MAYTTEKHGVKTNINFQDDGKTWIKKDQLEIGDEVSRYSVSLWFQRGTVTEITIPDRWKAKARGGDIMVRWRARRGIPEMEVPALGSHLLVWIDDMEK